MANVFDYVLKHTNMAHLFKTGSEGVSPSAATRSPTFAAAVRARRPHSQYAKVPCVSAYNFCGSSIAAFVNFAVKK